MRIGEQHGTGRLHGPLRRGQTDTNAPQPRQNLLRAREYHELEYFKEEINGCYGPPVRPCCDELLPIGVIYGTRKADLARRIRATLGLIAAITTSAVITGCDDSVGMVELDWKLTDSTGSRRLHPSCDIAANDANGVRNVALQVRLTISSTAGDCEHPADTALQPGCIVAQKVFPCDRYRGTIKDVPAADDAYLMTVDVLVQPDRGEPRFVPGPRCISVPGPRSRRIEAGRISSLAVYQLIVHSVDLERHSRYDLQNCGDPSITATEGESTPLIVGLDRRDPPC